MFICHRKPISDEPFADAERAGARVEKRIGQYDQQPAGPTPIVHDPGENERLGEGV
jgi:hypothetical protein